MAGDNEWSTRSYLREAETLTQSFVGIEAQNLSTIWLKKEKREREKKRFVAGNGVAIFNDFRFFG